MDYAAWRPVAARLYSSASSSCPAWRRLRAWSAAVLASRASPLVCPAGSGVGEGADDEGGFLVGVVGGADGSVFGSGVLAAPVGDAGLAEVAEAEGVAAGFGEEVAAEAEHVGPAAQAGVVGVAAEASSRRR